MDIIENYAIKYFIPVDIIYMIIKLPREKDIISFSLVNVEFSQTDQSVWKHIINLDCVELLPDINVDWKFIHHHIKKFNTLLKDGTRLDNSDMLQLGIFLGYSVHQKNNNLLKYVVDNSKYNSLNTFIYYGRIDTEFISDYGLMRAVEKNDFEMVKIILSDPDVEISIDTDLYKRGIQDQRSDLLNPLGSTNRTFGPLY